MKFENVIDVIHGFEEEGIVTEDRALCQKCIEKLEDE